MSNAMEAFEVGPEERLRVHAYDFLAGVLARPPDAQTLRRISHLEGDDSPLGRAVAALRRVAAATTPAAVENEFTSLFIGLGRGELLPYGSYYMTGFLNEKPLASLRDDMLRLRITRAANVFEPEDNIASLCEMMAGLIAGRFGAPAELDTQKQFFNRHLAPWAGHFFADLEAAKSSVFYAPVGTFGKAFMEIEREAFRMA